MGIFFQGVNTRLKDGRRYQVGKRYERNGDTFRANRDGSFTNERTGITFAGSSRSSKVKWFSDERRKSKRVRGPMTGGEGIPLNARTMGPAALVGGGSGPASPGVVRGPAQPSRAGGAGPATAVTVTQSTSGGSLAFPVPRTDLHVGSLKVGQAPVSEGGDAEDRWGEVGGAVVGLGVMAADLTVWAGEGLQQIGQQAARPRKERNPWMQNMMDYSEWVTQPFHGSMGHKSDGQGWVK